MNHVEKYWWIKFHSELNKVSDPTIELTPVMVNPENNTIEKDHLLNTKSQWWVKVMIPFWDIDPLAVVLHNHDWNLDTGGDTIEECIDNLYNLVKKHYGEDNE